MYTESLHTLKRATSIVLLASLFTFIIGPVRSVEAQATPQAVVVSATVGESVSLSVDDLDIGFGTLLVAANNFATAGGTQTSVEAPANTVSAGTNATSGYSITVAGATLTSTVVTDTIDAIGGTAAAPNPTDTEQFGIRLNKTTAGSATVTAPYNHATNYAYTGDVSASQIASVGGPTAVEDFDVYYLANIAALTPAGAYTTTLTYTVTANF